MWLYSSRHEIGMNLIRFPYAVLAFPITEPIHFPQPNKAQVSV